MKSSINLELATCVEATATLEEMSCASEQVLVQAVNARTLNNLLDDTLWMIINTLSVKLNIFPCSGIKAFALISINTPFHSYTNRTVNRQPGFLRDILKS